MAAVQQVSLTGEPLGGGLDVGGVAVEVGPWLGPVLGCVAVRAPTHPSLIMTGRRRAT